MAGMCGGIGLSAARAYTYNGIQAPQVEPNPLADQLEQKLSTLRAQLRSRAVEATLEAAIEQALLRNPELAQAFTQIQQREWSLIAVRRQWYPRIDANSVGPSNGLWGYRGSSTNQSNTVDNLETTQTINLAQDQLAVQLGLSWTFFDPTRAPQINAASEDVRSQELLFNVTARNLVLQTQLSYFSLKEQQRLIEAYDKILVATSDQVRQVESLFNVGNASIADVEQIRTQQYQTLGLLIKAYLGLIEASSALAEAMALPQGQLVLPADGMETYGSWDLSLDSSIAQAQALREELQSSLANANASRWRASALFKRYWPRLTIAASGSYLDSNSRTSVDGSPVRSVENSTRWDASIGVGFNWSIFDGGIAAAEGESQKALSRQYNDQAAKQRLQITREVEQSYASYETSRLALLSSREQAKSAQQAAIAIRQRFNVGYDTITAVVQALNQAISAANAYSASQGEYNNAVARLYRSTASWPADTLSVRDLSIELLRSR